MKIILLIIFVLPLPSYARNCQLDCPINFAPSPDPAHPFYYSQQRQRCLRSCEAANDQEDQLRQQSDELEEMQQQLEEQQQRIDELESEQ